MTGDVFSISLGSLPPKSEPELIDAEGGVHFALPHCSNHSIHPRDPLTLLPKEELTLVKCSKSSAASLSTSSVQLKAGCIGADNVSQVTSPT